MFPDQTKIDTVRDWFIASLLKKFFHRWYDRISIGKLIKYNSEHKNHTQYRKTVAVPETQVSYKVYFVHKLQITT